MAVQDRFHDDEVYKQARIFAVAKLDWPSSRCRQRDPRAYRASLYALILQLENDILHSVTLARAEVQAEQR